MLGQFKTIPIRGLFVALMLALAACIAIARPAGLEPHAAQSAAVVLLTLTLWSTAALPPFLTSLLFFALVIITGLAKPELILSGLGSTAVWLIISGFVIGSAITGTGLGQKLAGVLAPLLSRSYRRLIYGLTLTAMLLGFIMPSSTGRAVVLVPIGMALAEHLGFRKGSNGRIGVAVTLAMACNMPSFAILPANIPNMILAGASETLYGNTFGYAQYLFLHFPILGIVKSFVMATLVLKFFPDAIHANAFSSTSQAPSTVAEDEHLGQKQARVGIILLVTLALWMTDSIHGINSAWIGLLTAIVLLFPRIGVLPPKSFNASVDFGMVLYVSAALGLGTLVNSSGLGKLVGEGLASILPLSASQPFVSFYSLSLMSALTGIVTTTPGSPTVLTPMALDMAHSSGMSLSAVLMTQVIGFSTVFFPYQVGPLIIAMQLSGERLGSLLKITLPLALVTFTLLVPLDYFWWRLLGWL